MPEIPPPPSVPVYFIDRRILGWESGRAEGILSARNEEWGTTQLESLPDLFRRIASRAKGIPAEAMPDILGYLAGLLHLIAPGSSQDAEDLIPRPYATIYMKGLQSFLNTPKKQKSYHQERLENLHLWAGILVPGMDGKWTRADLSAFGIPWAEFLENLPQSETEENHGQEEQWAKAIRAWSDFRRRTEHGTYTPGSREIAPPDAPCWDEARQQLQRTTQSTCILEGNEQTLALFRLLLLFGVQLGPRVEWRWLDRARGGEPTLDPVTLAINMECSRRLFEGQSLPRGAMPKKLEQSRLLQKYRDTIRLKPYHPAFSGSHSEGCRKHLEQTQEVPSRLAAWIWFTDLADADLEKAPFGGDQLIGDAFCGAVAAAWPALGERVLQTGWYCEHGHSERSWRSPIPSLAAFQLMWLELWPSRHGGRIRDEETRRFPAVLMAPWKEEDLPSEHDAVSLFPLMDTSSDVLADIAQKLDVSWPPSTAQGALVKLRSLQEMSRIPGVVPASCWRTSESKFRDIRHDSWLAAQYLMLEHIADALDPNLPWDRRTMLTGRLVLPASRKTVHIAIPIIDDGQGNPKVPDMHVAFYPKPPRQWEQQEDESKWILELPQRRQARLFGWARALGVEQLDPRDPPAYEGTLVIAPNGIDAVSSLREEVAARLDLLLGVLKANGAEKLDQKAAKIMSAAATMHAVRVGRSELRWSGIGADRCVAFSLQAYEREQKEHRQGAVVLAEALALVVEQTAAIGDLQLALSAPRDQVKRMLSFRGVMIDELTREIGALAQQQMDLLLQRVADLIMALQRTTGIPEEAVVWHKEEVEDDQLPALIADLRRATGPLAMQSLSATERATPDWSRQFREELLRAVLSEEATAGGAIEAAHRLLAIMRAAGWDTASRARFLESGFLRLPSDLSNEPASDRALNIAVIATLIEKLVSGEWDGNSEVAQGLQARARELRDSLTVRPAQPDRDFLGQLTEELIPIDIEASGLLLIEWEEAQWLAVGNAFQLAGASKLKEFPRALRSLRDMLSRCLKEGSLTPLSQQVVKHRRWIREIETRIEHREITFDPGALSRVSGALPLPVIPLVCTTATVGTKAGGEFANIVTESQALRGRIAELFVLEACWQRFLQLDRQGRSRILDTIAEKRSGSHGSPPWGTGAAWERLKRQVEQRHEELTSFVSAAGSSDDLLARLFKDLIEVADERGPGFDVLDPFGVWGKQDVLVPLPLRVEVKAIMPIGDAKNGHHIVLSTNEFHRASQDPESYLLRLIYVPQNEEDLAGVHWAYDIPNPLRTFDLDQLLVKGVRSGVLPLIVRPGVRG